MVERHVCFNIYIFIYMQVILPLDGLINRQVDSNFDISACSVIRLVDMCHETIAKSTRDDDTVEDGIRNIHDTNRRVALVYYRYIA